MKVITVSDNKDWGMPGVYRGIPAAQYHALDACNATSLKTLAESTPAHCKHKKDNPTRTKALDDGEALHTCILEPHRFLHDYAVSLGCSGTTTKGKPCSKDGTTKAGGKWWCSDHLPEYLPLDNVKRLTAEHHARLLATRVSVFNNLTARAILNHPSRETELSLVWFDESTGILCKARLDIFLPQDQLIADLKSTTCAGAGPFSRTIGDYRYDIQAEWYRRAADACFGMNFYKFNFIAIEDEAPFGVQVFQPDEKCFEAGRLGVESTIAVYAECHRSGNWPGYPHSTTLISVPKYILDREQRLCGQP